MPFSRSGRASAGNVLAGCRSLARVFAFVAALLASAFGPPAAARDVVADPNLVVQRLRGPVTVVVIANPFRYPWVVKVGRSTLSGPAAPAGAQLFPQPLSGPQTIAASNDPDITVGGLAPTPAPTGGIAVTMLPNPGGVTDATVACDASRFDGFERCVRDLETQVQYTKKFDIELAYESVCAAQLEFLALQARTDQLLASSYFDTEAHRQVTSKRLIGLLSDSVGGAPQASCSKSDETRRSMYGIRTGAATVASARAAIDRIRAFPDGSVTSELKQADSLTASIGKFDEAKIDSQTIDDIVVSKHCSAVKAPEPKPKEKKRSPAETTKANAAAQKKCADAAKKAATADVSGSVRSGSFRKTQALSRLAAITAAMKPYATDAKYPTTYAAAVVQLQYLRSIVLTNVGLSRFFVKVDERCQGLYGAAAKTTVTVQRADNESNSVIIDCPSRAFTSFGFAFERNAQQTLTAVPANGGLPAGPPGGPTPAPITLEVTQASDVKPVPVVMFNVLLSPAELNDNGFYGSFGIGLSTAQNNSPIISDYFLGLSYSFTRSLIATAGFALGTTQEALPGYAPGLAAAQAGTPTTLSRLKVVPFLAVTYGPR